MDSRKIIGCLFVLLALLLVWAASKPRIRSHFHWGLTVTAVPMSVVGLSVWIGCSLLISATAFGFLPVIAIFCVVPILAVAGLYDSCRNSKK